MGEIWANSGIDLLVSTQWAKRRASLEDALRRGIRTGRLPGGTRLPSSRTLARDLGWSRGTVAAAYDQLVAEGYLAAQPGSGTEVAFQGLAEPDPPDRPVWTPSWRFDLRPGPPPVGAFPVDAWLRHLRDAVRDAPQTAFGYGDPAGNAELRTELAAYLGRVRGAQASPASVVITAGITQGLSLLAGILARTAAGQSIAMEDPGFGFHRKVIAQSGPPVVPLPVDGRGADPGALAAGIGAAVLTPSHQYPTGTTMSPARRMQFVEWARSTHGWIVEDDYDGELRYDRRPIAALQGIAPDRVIYLGTASKTLAPALRLGWMVVPDALMDAVVEAQHRTLHSIDPIGQLTLAHLIGHHGYDKHVRAVRTSYRQRFQQLAALIDQLASDHQGLRLGGISAGGQAALYLPDATPGEQAVIEVATTEDLGLEGLAESSHEPGTHPAGLLIGFSRPSHHLYQPTLDSLARVLRRAHR